MQTVSLRDARARARRGYTLVEVMMAAFVLALIFVSTIAALQVGFKSVETARSTNLAAQALQSEMENIRSLHWNDILAMGTNWSAWTRLNTREEFAQASSAFEFRRRTIALGGTLRVVEVQTRWVGANGILHVRTFTNLFAQDGLSGYYYVK